MSQFTDFEREYMLQTRREIDTEKQERDHILNFAVVVLGAIAFAIVQSEKMADFLKNPEALVFEVSGLLVITTLFWVRWKKLQQIADRWYVLHRMLVRHLDTSDVAECLEAVVVRDLGGRRYLAKDVALNAALSLPVYALIGQYAVVAAAVGEPWRTAVALTAAVMHAVISAALLLRPLRDPLPLAQGEEGGAMSGESRRGLRLPPG